MIRFSTAKELGALIRAERKRRGYTQELLADFSGVGVTFLSQLENGKPTAELEKMLRVAQTLGIDLYAESRLDHD